MSYIIDPSFEFDPSVYDAIASLSLQCGAFDLKRRKGESAKQAKVRASADFRRAVKMFMACMIIKEGADELRATRSESKAPKGGG